MLNAQNDTASLRLGRRGFRGKGGGHLGVVYHHHTLTDSIPDFRPSRTSQPTRAMRAKSESTCST